MHSNTIDNQGLYRGRILFVTSNYPRWSGDSTTPFILHLAQDLQEIGWKVDVLAPHAHGTSLCETLDGVHVERFRYLWPTSLETVCYQGGALINLRKNPLNNLKLPPLILFECLGILRRLLQGKYDLLHSHWILPQGFTGTLTAVPLGIPHIITVHGSDIFALRNTIFNLCKRFALSNADAVTVNSSATEKAVTEIAPQLKDLIKIPMGVSMGKNSPLPSSVEIRKLYRQGQGPLIIFTGRIVIEKGIEDLINAVAQVVPQLPDISLLIIGEGQDRQELEDKVKILGLSNRIVFCGWVSPEIVANYLSAGDIFISPSWADAQGLTVIEAMLMKTPVIATNVGGILDVVENEKTGLLVEKSAPQEIAQAIARLVQEPKLTHELSIQGYEFAKKNFSREKSADSFTYLFERIIHAKRNIK